jgi:hypothetical protein
MNKKFFKFEFVTEDVSEIQADALWDKIVSQVEFLKGSITGVYTEVTLEQLLNDNEEHEDTQTTTTKIG